MDRVTWERKGSATSQNTVPNRTECAAARLPVGSTPRPEEPPVRPVSRRVSQHEARRIVKPPDSARTGYGCQAEVTYLELTMDKESASPASVGAKSIDDVGRPPGRLRDCIVVKGRRLFRRMNSYLAAQSLVPDAAVLDNTAFPFVANLERHHADVREELDRILTMRDGLPSFHEISPDQKRISREDNWKAFMLWGFGERSERNCGRCPKTAALLETIPGLQSAWFSIIGPRYRIPRHRGVTKGIIRVHLSLIVPRERHHCRMIVGTDTVVWQEGRCVVFDDTRHHEVHNDMDEERLVLLIDVDRPMRLGGRIVHRTMVRLLKLSPYFRDAKRSHRRWEESFERRLSAVERDLN